MERMVLTWRCTGCEGQQLLLRLRFEARLAQMELSQARAWP